MPRPALAPLSMLMRLPAPAFAAAVLVAPATHTAPATAQETLRGEVPEELREGPPGDMSERLEEQQKLPLQPQPDLTPETARGAVPGELRDDPSRLMSDRQGERQDPLFQPRPAPAGPE